MLLRSASLRLQLIILRPAAAGALVVLWLLSACRSGVASKISRGEQSLSSPNIRDDEGTAPLMKAARNGDVRAVDALLASGADPNLKNNSGATALMWGVASSRVIELLLQHGADPNAKPDSGHTALTIAANSDGTSDVAKLLISRGADVNAPAASGFTPLHAASFSGDPELIDLLLEKGANAKTVNRVGWTALHGAATMGDLRMVRALLNARADCNATDSSGTTPLMWAAASGASEVVELLLERGAQPNARETFHGGTPLIWAAAGAKTEAVRLLLSAGANTEACDDDGDTAAAWAARQGEPALLKLLGVSQRSSAPRQERTTAAFEGNDVATAVSRSLPLLRRSGAALVANSAENCVSCHHQSLPAMAFRFAREGGVSVEEETFREIAAATLQELGPRRERLMLGVGVPDPLDPAYLLLALGAAKRTPDKTTDALVHFLTLKQSRNGRWRSVLHRPPMDDSDFTSTAVSLRALALFAPVDRREEIADRIRRAASWLKTASPKTTEDRAFQLLGLTWANAGGAALERRASELLEMQRPNGGWSQLPGLASDAYATGEVLFALNQSGQLRTTDPGYRRGVAFLLQTQRPDGSWFVQSRSLPVQPYFDSGFPHGKSQFISCAATSWAVMALALSLPTRTAQRR